MGPSAWPTWGGFAFPLLSRLWTSIHAMEHAGQVLVALLGSKEHPDYKTRLGRWARQLLTDRVEKFIAQTRKECAGQSNDQAVEKELGYFVDNVSRMQYGTFRHKGFFIGSGVVEAGCKTVIGARCKQSGMFWGEPGAENILALRCIRIFITTGTFICSTWWIIIISRTRGSRDTTRPRMNIFRRRSGGSRATPRALRMVFAVSIRAADWFCLAKVSTKAFRSCTSRTG